MGPSNLRIFDATKDASKPVYLRLKILRGRSQDQSGRSQDQSEDQSEDPSEDQSEDQSEDPSENLSIFKIKPSQTAV